MLDDEKVSLKGKNIKNLYMMNNQSYTKRNNSPIMSNNTNLYNYIYNNPQNKVYNNANITNKKIFQYPSYQEHFNNSNNYYIPASHQYFNCDKKTIYEPNISENREKELLINKIKDYINKNEKKKGMKIIKDYYSKSYMDMIKNNIDTYPNGINLSICNCETQYPINDLNEDDVFFRKLKSIFDNYENSNKKNNNINNLKTSYEFYSKILKKNGDNKNLFKTQRYLNEAVGEMSNINRNIFNNKINHKDNYIINKNDNFNKRIGKFDKEYNKACNNFLSVNKNNDIKYKNVKSDNEICGTEKYTINNMEEKSNKKAFKNSTKSRIKLMNIDKKKEIKNFYKDNNQYKIINNKSQIIGKNLKKEYELQEKYISKIKLFIEYIESFFISSLIKFFRYFIKNLQFYSLHQLSKNKDCKKLLKRFQKTRNINLKYNSISFYKNNYNTINYTYNSNENNLIDNFGHKNRLNISKIKNQINNVSPDVYIPKNKINRFNLSNNKKRKNLGISSNISNQKDFENTENKTNISTDYYSKKIFNSNEKINFLPKNTIIHKNYINNKEAYAINKEIDKNPIKNTISSFGISSKNNSFDKTYSKKKPSIYWKPKSGGNNLKKMLIFKGKDINDRINSDDKKLKYNYNSLNNKNTNNICCNSKIIKSLLFEKDNYKSPLKVNSPIEHQKFIYKNKKTEINNLKIRVPIKHFIDELVVKDIVTYDKRLWVTIKYVSSENSNNKFFKMKIKRRMLNINDQKNIFLNKELELIQPTIIESIEIIPPITAPNSIIKKNENKISVIPEEKEDISISNKIIEMIKTIQKAQNRNILYFYNYFFNNLKKIYNSLSQKSIFNNIQNNFKKLNEIDISKISNNIIEDNSDEIIEDNNYKDYEKINNNIKIKNIKKEYLKRNLFQDKKIPRINTADNIYENHEILNNSNKSDFFERSQFSDNTNGEKDLNFSVMYNKIPKKNSYRLKRTRYKIFIGRIGENKNVKNKKDIIKEDKEMRKRNKMIFLLTNKFNYYNNCIRIMRNFFNIWKNKDDICILDNDNIINEELKIYNNNFHVKGKSNNMIKKIDEKNVKEDFEIKDEDNASNIDYLNNAKVEGIIKINDLIKNNNDVFNLTLNTLNTLNKQNNQKGIQIDSIQDSEDDNKSIHFDKNELEEKIEYFRMYLINYYAYKRRNGGSSEEEKEG